MSKVLLTYKNAVFLGILYGCRQQVRMRINNPIRFEHLKHLGYVFYSYTLMFLFHPPMA